MAIFFSLLAGCNPGAKDKLLRTFFDGVPTAGLVSEEKNPADNLEKDSEAKTGINSPLPETPTQFAHQPFLENQCDSCHDKKSSQKVAREGKELCFGCHDDFIKGKNVLHYHVSEGACIDCHDPHQSENKYLLKKAIPEICFSCHDQKEVEANTAHDGKASCIECHDAHASIKEKLLK